MGWARPEIWGVRRSIVRNSGYEYVTTLETEEKGDEKTSHKRIENKGGTAVES